MAQNVSFYLYFQYLEKKKKTFTQNFTFLNSYDDMSWLNLKNNLWKEEYCKVYFSIGDSQMGKLSCISATHFVLNEIISRLKGCNVESM